MPVEACTGSALHECWRNPLLHFVTNLSTIICWQLHAGQQQYKRNVFWFSMATMVTRKRDTYFVLSSPRLSWTPLYLCPAAAISLQLRIIFMHTCMRAKLLSRWTWYILLIKEIGICIRYSADVRLIILYVDRWDKILFISWVKYTWYYRVVHTVLRLLTPVFFSSVQPIDP